MLNKLEEWVGNIDLYPGDTVTISYDDKDLVKHEVTEKIHITTAKLYEFKDEFELKSGFAAVIGDEVIKNG